MSDFRHQPPDPVDLHILGDRLLRITRALQDLPRTRPDTDALEHLVRVTPTCLGTSRQAAELATQTAVSSAACTVDGRTAIDLLTKVVGGVTAASAHITAALSAVRHGHRAVGDGHARAALAELSPAHRACTDAHAALFRHAGILDAQREAEAHPGPEEEPEAVTESQRQALAHIACGIAVLHTYGYDRPRELRGAGTVRTATLDALVKRELVVLTALPDAPLVKTVTLTPAGRHALLAAATARRALPAAAPATVAGRSVRPTAARR
ncbi:hypothetical protein ACIGW7_18970 [Streptomyces sp. NPDC053253]|uniref:hypothetical protein n=1 Tax=Streptomyces sp. NPDC053253 TaxID=3365699 RepID=UPI0037CE7580